MGIDLSTLSDEDLKSMYGGGAAAPVAPVASSPSDMTDAQLQAAYAAPGHPVAGPSGSLLTDIPRSIGSGIIDAVTGLASPLLRAAPGAVGVSYSGDTPHVTQPVQNPTEQQKNDALREGRDNLYNAAGVTEYQPATELGRIAQSGLTAGLAGAMTGGGFLPSVVGGAVGQGLIEHTPLPPLAAAMIGQLAGAKATGMAQGAAAPYLPGAMDAETRALAQKAQDYGISVPLGKVSNNPFVRYADSMVRKMPFSGFGALDELNQTAFNKGLAGSFGETADKIMPETINNAYDRIGNVFTTVGGRTNLNFDNSLINDLANAETRANTAGLDAGPQKAINDQIKKIQDIGAANNGVIPGDVYQNITARKSGLSDLQQHGQGIVRDVAGDVRSALDDALMRSAAPEDVAALQQARTQYKALKTVEPLTMRADTPGGATPTTGDISPAALLSRVNQQYRNAPRAELGDLPLKDLAQIGQRFLKEPGSSGTAERGMIGNMLQHGGSGLVGALLGGGAEHVGLPLEYTIPAVAGPLVAAPLAGALLRSPGVVARQINGPQFSPLAQVLAGQSANGRLSAP